MADPAQNRAEDRIDPATVPQRVLYTGAKMPAIGLGTFGSDHVPAEDVAQAVLGAASVGYRHFDCAAVYANEAQIGESLRVAISGGIAREELWVTSKLWNNKHNPADVVPPASSPSTTCNSVTSICTWSTGLSPTTMTRGSISLRAARMHDLIFMQTTWQRGGRWRSLSSWDLPGTSAPRT